MKILNSEAVFPGLSLAQVPAAALGSPAPGRAQPALERWVPALSAMRHPRPEPTRQTRTAENTGRKWKQTLPVPGCTRR